MFLAVPSDFSMQPWLPAWTHLRGASKDLLLMLLFPVVPPHPDPRLSCGCSSTLPQVCLEAEISRILLYVEGRDTEKRKEEENAKVTLKRPMPVPFWPTLSDTGLAFSIAFIMETADGKVFYF